MQTIETAETETMTENSLTPEDIAALIADAPGVEGIESTPDAFCPTDAAGVDWVLGKIAAARAEAKLIRENMEAMARACERKAEHLEWKYGAALQTYLRAELGDGRGRSKRLPHGVLGYRTKPAGIAVTDPGAALAWTRENLPDALRVDKKALGEALLATGEAVPFAAFQAAEDVFYIK